ncbi:hypothetical protein B0T14DRAFT_493271 [Immersiella caudata]|uniref:Rhodopsin domain-containing protein n=1 Tax=Immersiella caudata TaxID=314043 RepID=A0AA40C738_9PEZI|nr:hypothetical protein B0T14DRAFT_493271 [Immersiella caudata]
MASNKKYGLILPILDIAFSVVVYVIRIIIRRLFFDPADWTVTIAVAANAASCGLTIAAIKHGFGEHTSGIPEGSASLLLWDRILGVNASGFARTSIALFHLRLHQDIGLNPLWKYAFRTIGILQILFIILYEAVQLHLCKKFEPQCLGHGQTIAFSIISTAIYVLSDFIFTATFIHYILRLPSLRWQEKAYLIVQASCLLATACEIPKMVFLFASDAGTSDAMWELTLMPRFIWCKVGEAAIVITACTQPLTRATREVLGRLGESVRIQTSADIAILEEGEWYGEKRVYTASASEFPEGDSTVLYAAYIRDR